MWNEELLCAWITGSSNHKLPMSYRLLLFRQDGCIYQKVGLHTGPQVQKQHTTNYNNKTKLINTTTN